jgi:hypothetical protein
MQNGTYFPLMIPFLDDGNDLNSNTHHTAMKNFLTRNPSEQLEALRKQLRFILNVSWEAYSKLKDEFSTEMEKIRETSKTGMLQDSCHKLLFQKILDIWDVILKAEQKRDREMKITRKEFNEISWKLIVGESVHFSADVRSERLAELLLDLKDLETNGKVSVSGEVIVCSDYKLALDNLLQCELEEAE